MTLTLEDGRLAVVVAPERGGRLLSLRVDGHELLSTTDVPGVPDSVTHGCYPMVPWAGRVRDGLVEDGGIEHALPVEADGHALHGLGRDAVWTVAEGGDATAVDLEVPLGAPWPAEGTARLSYRLADDALTCRLTWDGDGPGASLGFHPWFRRRLDDGTEVELDVGLARMLERGSDHLPTGRVVDVGPRPWDDCFVVDREPVLRWDDRVALRLTADTVWWVVFTEPEHAVCVEPQTAPPDAFGGRGPAEDLARRSLVFVLAAL